MFCRNFGSDLRSLGARNFAIQKHNFENCKHQIDEHKEGDVFGGAGWILTNYDQVKSSIGDKLHGHGEEIQLNKKARIISFVEVTEYD